MMYPYLTLDDETEIVHSEMLSDNTVNAGRGSTPRSELVLLGITWSWEGDCGQSTFHTQLSL